MMTLLLMMLIVGRRMLMLKTKTNFLPIFFGFFGLIFNRAFKPKGGGRQAMAGEISREGAGNRAIFLPAAKGGDATRLEGLMSWRGG